MPAAAPLRLSIHLPGRQVHLRRQGKGAPVLLLHEAGRSSTSMLPLMAEAPAELTVIAPDLPGHGLSDPLPLAAPEAADYADALADALSVLGIWRCPVYGTQAGASIALALAQRYPERVSAVVLDGLPCFEAAERAQWLAGALPPFVPQADGTHMAWVWSRVRDEAQFFPWHQRGNGSLVAPVLPPVAALHAAAMDLLASGDGHRAPWRAALRLRPAEVLPWLTMPVHVAAREDDVLLAHLTRVPRSLPVHRLPPRGAEWAAQVWAWLAQAAREGLPPPPPADAPLTVPRLSDTFAGPAGARWHLRGSLAGSGRPRVWLHPSPGGARALDGVMQRHAGERPVLALDLPGHGDSDAGSTSMPELAEQIATLLRDRGIPDAELVGEGLGEWLAATVARRLGQTPLPPAEPEPGAEPPEPFTPRADGGHLLAAWLHARDELVMGGWWQRGGTRRADFGDDLDVAAAHARAVEALKERPEAAALRADWLLACGRR